MTNAQPPKIVVTGAAGWFGSNLIEALIHGLVDGPNLPADIQDVTVRAGVFPTVFPKYDAHSDRVEWVLSDVRNEQDLNLLFHATDHPVVIHCAGLIHPRRIKDLYEVNLIGTLNVIRAAAAKRSKRVVLLSSNSVMGASNNPETTFDESSPYNPYMNYGRSKMLMEQRATELASTLDIELVIIRAPWFYGPKQPTRQTTFFSMIRNGRAPIIGSGNNLRSMAYVDNLSQGLLLSATNPDAAGESYWIADERPYRWKEIIDTVESLLNDEFDLACKGGRIHLPNLVCTTAKVADSLIQKTGFYNQKTHVLSEVPLTVACDISKAKKQLGYMPRVSLREGMRRSIKSCIDSGMNI